MNDRDEPRRTSGLQVLRMSTPWPPTSASDADAVRPTGSPSASSPATTTSDAAAAGTPVSSGDPAMTGAVPVLADDDDLPPALSASALIPMPLSEGPIDLSLSAIRPIPTDPDAPVPLSLTALRPVPVDPDAGPRPAIPSATTTVPAPPGLPRLSTGDAPAAAAAPPPPASMQLTSTATPVARTTSNSATVSPAANAAEGASAGMSARAPRGSQPGLSIDPSTLAEGGAARRTTGRIEGPPAQLGAILRDTRRAMKNRQLYSHIDNHGGEQLTTTHTRLTQLMHEVGRIALRVEVSTFHWRGSAIFHDDARDMNFVYSLYRSGVREVILQPGLGFDEFNAFWSIVASDLGDTSGEDLLTRLWLQGFEQISWVAHQALDDLRDDNRRIEDGLRASLQAMGSAARIEAALATYQPVLAPFVDDLTQRAHAAGLPPLAGNILLRDLQAERERVAASVGRLLMDIALLNSHPDGGDSLIDAFAQMTTTIIAEGKLAQLCALAQQAWSLASSVTDDAQRAALAKALVGYGQTVRRPEHVERIGALATQPNLTLAHDASLLLLRVIGAEGVEPLLRLLELNVPGPLRAQICQVLVEHGASAAALLARRLRSASEVMARELLDVVRATQMPRRALLCERALGHTNGDVRRHAMMVLATCNEPVDGAGVLGRHLKTCTDPDERLACLDALGRCECPESEKVLLGLLGGEGVPTTELHGAWRALLGLGSQTALRAAAGAARHPTRGLLGSARDEDVKAALVAVLVQREDPVSFKLLQMIADDENASSRALHKKAADVAAQWKNRFGPAT